MFAESFNLSQKSCFELAKKLEEVEDKISNVAAKAQFNDTHEDELDALMLYRTKITKILNQKRKDEAPVVSVSSTILQMRK